MVPSSRAGGKVFFARNFGLFSATLGLAWLAIACAGCGGGGSGDPLVLRAVGFFMEPAEPSNESPPTASANLPDPGRSVSFSQTVQIPDDPDNDGDADGGYIGLENTQSSAAITTTGAQISYAIEGSSFQVPGVFLPFSVNLPPVGTGTAGSNIVFVQLLLVSQATMDFLRTNAASLPPPPFQMVVTVTIEGQSSAGATFTSNSLDYPITFND
jgi:hypothetical protein